ERESYMLDQHPGYRQRPDRHLAGDRRPAGPANGASEFRRIGAGLPELRRTPQAIRGICQFTARSCGVYRENARDVLMSSTMKLNVRRYKADDRARHRL